MGKIYFLMGKSASGKDTIYTKLLKDESLGLTPYVGYTTRPIRVGERNGVEYFFTTEADLKEFERSGKLIEKRIYHTVYGDWYYYSVDSDYVKLDERDYLYIGTLESYVKMRDYYGADRIVPIYVEVEDGCRLMRAIERERRQAKPGYAEMCRRFLTDSEDFSEDKLAECGICAADRFENDDMDSCISAIRKRAFGRE